MKETIARINKINSWFIEKKNKIDKPLARLIKEKRGTPQINRSRNEKGKVTTDTTERQRIMRDYYKHLFANKVYNLEKWRNSRKAQPSETEPGRNRKYKQTNHKH